MSNELNKRWVPQNRLTSARDKHRRLSDVALAMVHTAANKSPIEPVISPLVRPMGRPMTSPMVRKMGATTIDTRKRSMISSDLWDNTPVKLAVANKIIGDVDLTSQLEGFDSIGWEWNRRENKLFAYVSTNGEKFIVKIPASTIKRVFNNCLSCQQSDYVIRGKTLDGVFKSLGKGLKKASKRYSPTRFAKNPRQFVNDASRDIKTLVKGAGRQMINVASSPIFGGVMAGMAAIPPLTAVGAAGLAAFAAANAVKPAYDALETTIDTVDAVKKKKKAKDITNNFSSNSKQMPIAAKKLMTSALKSTSGDKTPKSVRNFRKNRAIFRLKENRLSRI